MEHSNMQIYQIIKWGKLLVINYKLLRLNNLPKIK